MLNGVQIDIDRVQLAENFGNGLSLSRVTASKQGLATVLSDWSAAFSKYFTYVDDSSRLAVFDANARLMTLVDERLAGSCRQLASRVQRGCRGPEDRTQVQEIEVQVLWRLNHPLLARLKRAFGI